jgi:hypothetical protein
MDKSHTGNIDSVVPEIIPEKFFARLVAGYEIDGEGLNNDNDVTKPGLEQVYITLGHLLLLINKLGMIYDRSTANDKTNQRSYIYIDVNPETNRCYTFPGHCSLDPTICLIGSQQLPFGITSKYFSNIYNTFPFYGDNLNAPGIGDANLGGKFMYTLVNINYVAGIMKKWRTNDTKGNIYFVDLVKDILDGISKATGGYNEYRIVPDDDSNCIRILDDRRTTGPGQSLSDNYYTEIPVLGKKSIVYNFNYTSKISPNTAAMIVVAAQAQPYGVQGAENALAFSHLNKGLYNRLNTVRVDAATDANQNANTNDDVTQRYIELRDFIENIYDGVGTGARSSTAAESAERERELGVEQTADVRLQSVPKEQIKGLAIERLDRIYEDLRDEARGLEDKGELIALQNTYNTVKSNINSLDINALASAISKVSTGTFNESKNEVEFSNSALNNYLHDKLESDYKSIFLIRDTAIEARWTQLANQQTGINRSWY